LKPIHRVFFSAGIFILAFQTLSWSKEDPALYEKIQENFLKEDYQNTLRLSDTFLKSQASKAPLSNEVLYLKALSLLKLGRGEEARQIWRDLETKRSTAQERVFARSAAISIADSFYFEGQKNKARQSYQAALSKFPDSEETGYVRHRIRELE